MAAEVEEDISGLALLKQPATRALTAFLNDLLATISFQAYLWEMIVTVDYGHGDPTRFPKPGEPAPPESAAAQMDEHSAVLREMLFCRGVNSFLTYLADLMTLIYEKYPRKLPSNKLVTYKFCIERHTADDLIPALAEETVRELTHQNLDALAKYFKNCLDLLLFTRDTHSLNASVCVDIRNIITHNRGIVNRFFIQRHPDYRSELGRRMAIDENTQREMLGTLGYCARQLDIRAVKKFGLPTIEPQLSREGVDGAQRS